MTDDAEVMAAPATRRVGWLGVVIIAALSAGIAATVAVALTLRLGATGAVAPLTERELYQCPMHPSIRQDHPGTCPICGMKLLKIEIGKASLEGPAPTGSARKISFYRSPSDPTQTSHEPRKDELGADYLPVYEDEVQVASAVSGLATIDIDPERQQLIGLTTAEVVRGPMGGSWRTVGRVAMDETRVRHINLKVPGFVERIYVDFIGKRVKRGDPLFSLYSPELLSAQEEYLLALRTERALSTRGEGSSGGPPAADAGSAGGALIAAARRKLELWDVPAAELQRVTRTGEPTKTLTLYSPVAGVVTKKDVVEGMKLDAGSMPYEIVDLSTVWVLADVYESELRFVRDDMTATLRLNAYPNREFQGKVMFIDPLLDPMTRTVKVRLSFPNPTGELRPEMFGDVVLHGAPHDGLLIPQDAVLDSGTDKIVFVALGAGKFQPRKVKLGDSDAVRVEVVSGLQLGERVVTRANFLIDSESRLQGSLAEMSEPEAGAPERARVLPDPLGASTAGSDEAAPSAAAPRAPAAPPPPASAPPAHHSHAP
ncbi:MAG: efflux RND transporter periplasmic adaptor subunit [Kofleriaceae bacterium]